MARKREEENPGVRVERGSNSGRVTFVATGMPVSVTTAGAA
jgi:hypothetical protein